MVRREAPPRPPRLRHHRHEDSSSRAAVQPQSPLTPSPSRSNPSDRTPALIAPMLPLPTAAPTNLLLRRPRESSRPPPVGIPRHSSGPQPQSRPSPRVVSCREGPPQSLHDVSASHSTRIPACSFRANHPVSDTRERRPMTTSTNRWSGFPGVAIVAASSRIAGPGSQPAI
jgi:hypothetical protein